MTFKNSILKKDDCPYCAGKGYFQLVLGGSETCEKCEGTGKTKEEEKVYQ
ncbi:YuiA family protein [Anaerobacillus sp. MEB173]